MAEPPGAPTQRLRVAGAQISNVVGDIDGNARRIGEAMEWAEEREADLLLLPELALTGYPVEDLAVRKDFVAAAVAALGGLAARSGSVATIVGTLDPVPPRRSWDTQTREVAIGAALLCDGELRGIYHKVLLPNYAVFDEARNFAPGIEPGVVWRIGEAVVGLSICEDSWSADGPPEAQAANGAQLLLFQNASPFERAKSDARLAHCRRLARRNGLPVLYVNSVGGQDELVFDGGSVVVSASGELVHRAPQFETDRFCLDLDLGSTRPAPARPRTVHARAVPHRRQPLEEPRSTEPSSDLEQIWAALAMGVRDFALHNGTDEAVVAISGGIDAAVAGAVAVDALGPSRVRGIFMPGPRTRDSEAEDARELAKALGISFQSFPVEPVTDRIGPEVSEIAGRDRGELVRRNLDSRMRAAILQTIADEVGALAVATVNKTELSVGSFAPHDAMAGGFAPLKDCTKTLVYALARHRNERGPAIPERTIERTPTAFLIEELALSSYEEIDQILERRLELAEEPEQIAAAGFDAELVRAVLQLIDGTEMQRRQSPPGVKISRRAFGTDRRMPISNQWEPFRREREHLAPGVASGPVLPVPDTDEQS